MTPPPEFDPYALLDHPELAKAPGVHDGKRTKPCLCTSDDSGSSHDAQHPGEYLNDYGDWEECGWCGGQGFRYADCTRCDGSSFEPAEPPAPLPDTGDGRPDVIEDEKSIVVRSDVQVDGRYVWGGTYLGDDALTNAERRAAKQNEDWPNFAPFRLYGRRRVVTEWLLADGTTPAPSPSQPEPGTLAKLRAASDRMTAATAAFDRLGEPIDRDAQAEWLTAIGLLRWHVITLLDATPPAPPAVPGDRPATELAPAMHVIRRADGDEMGEFAFFATDGPDGWDVAENTDNDEDTVYEILACYPVARRKMLCSTLCPTCDGEGEDGIGTMCPSCGGSGEHEAPDAEHLMIHVYADAQPAHPAPDGEPDEYEAIPGWHWSAPFPDGAVFVGNEDYGNEKPYPHGRIFRRLAPPGGYGVADGTAT